MRNAAKWTSLMLAVALTACAETGGMGEQWQTISEDKFSIEFDAPDLIGRPRTFLYNLDRGGYHKKFLGRWAGRGPKFARAEMFVMSLGAGYLFTADPDLKKMVRRARLRRTFRSKRKAD